MNQSIDWPIFERPKSVSLGLDRVRLLGNFKRNPVRHPEGLDSGRVAIVSRQSRESFFTMDADEMRDLVNALQKALAVMEYSDGGK